MKLFKSAAVRLGIKKVEKQLLKEARKVANRVRKDLGKALPTVLQTGGHTLKKHTLKALKLTKEQGNNAIEALKKAERLPHNFHGKIMSNGDYIHPHYRRNFRKLIRSCKLNKLIILDKLIIYMGSNHFITKSHCELAIISNTITPEEISQTLALKPDRSFKKGETYKSKKSGSIITHIHNLWAKSTKEILSELEDLTPHFNYLEEILKNRMSLLEKYKTNKQLEVNLWIWIETDNAGIGFDLNEQQLNFINKICNRCSFSLLAKETVIVE